MTSAGHLTTSGQLITSGHLITRTLTETVMYPAHQARTESPEYRRVHNHLIDVLDEPCWSCGVRRTTLADPVANHRGATQMETHHFHIEWALANAVDPAKVLADFPEMKDATDASLRAWLDSEGQMLVLCDIDHRSGHYGIHSITYPVWTAQKFFRDGWDLTSGLKVRG